MEVGSTLPNGYGLPDGVVDGGGDGGNGGMGGAGGLSGGGGDALPLLVGSLPRGGERGEAAVRGML